MADEFAAHQVPDIGCGTGMSALLLADRGIEVVGIDPSSASIDVARAKPGSERVRWICGGATDLPPLQANLAILTLWGPLHGPVSLEIYGHLHTKTKRPEKLFQEELAQLMRNLGVSDKL
jgi:SAM-dependent methyltransferase